MSILRSMVSRSQAFQAFFFLLALMGASVLFAIPAQAAGQADDNAAGQEGGPADYIIGAEDVLDISVWKNADLSRVVNVRPDGKISLPLIGDVQAGGLTPNQLKDEITRRLQAYQETAVVSVIVEAVNSYRVFIVGEIRTPGTYLLKNKTTVLQAIALAGGFTQFASKNKIRIIRQKGDGTNERIRIRFKDLVYGDDDTNSNLILNPGDTIFVP